MNAPNHDLPQEWPEHLAEEAVVSPVRTAPPISEAVLDFTPMHSTTFEQFCWWLLKKDQTLIGCQQVGGGKTEQGGIDLFAFDEQQPDKLSVFECKAWKDFRPSRLTRAVDNFLEGDWSGSTHKFTIILAQKVAGPTLWQQWLKERQRLREAGIDGELWTAMDVTRKVQPYPDILSKFFPWHSIEHYANLWMQQQSFVELVNKSFFDPREPVARRARGFVAQSDGKHTTASDPNSLTKPTGSASQGRSEDIDTLSSLPVDGTYRKIDQFGSSWHFKGPWFSLSAILPDQRFSHASAAIAFNPRDMQGVTLTVDHKWLLTRFLFRQGSPPTSQYRGFIVGTTRPDEDQHIVDLPHCRLSLESDGVKEIAGVADLLTDVVRNALNALEIAWSAVDFPFVMRAGKKVALAAINKDVWHELGRFAEEHDFSKGTSPWHMFDGNREVLKPYHKTANENFDAGYHGIFQAAPIDGLSRRNEVVLLWQPHDLLSDQAFSPRGWWSCEFAFQWLNEVLLPEVKRRVYERHFGGRWKRIFHSRRTHEFAARLDDLFVARDLRQSPLIRHGNWTASIIESAAPLSCRGNSRAIYSPVRDGESLSSRRDHCPRQAWLCPLRRFKAGIASQPCGSR